MSISKHNLLTGKTTISLVSGNNIYSDWVYFTDLRAPINTYSVNKIILNCNCVLNNLYIGQNVNNRIKLNCDSIVISGKFYCETEETLSKGFCCIYEDTSPLTSTYISPSIDLSDFTTSIK